jgi:hypothetical protein
LLTLHHQRYIFFLLIKFCHLIWARRVSPNSTTCLFFLSALPFW